VLPLAALLGRRRLLVLVLAALFAAVFAVLDAREVAHQVAIAQPQLATLAGAIAVLHAATATTVVMLIRVASVNARTSR
jgi:hypothetical protein